ncbi:helix-turn-helix domain-containing protein [Tsukamurella tyrosinosolvens]|uniref:helix-turn-helix domain-containing protein n=1 Tax=Tsukamurella tyrosinosolvens TaxID=57704 RepID=UPI000C7E86BE|nr:helix-turn-helix domain-containing protein [Tsukamurella tyrosinosolvens]AUN39847.1 transcriptional regulator [Tsukamurella tyrosinosolvens]QRY82567.1 helix-turn-helix domain-containing protein [Tsukamurella tyrosinosolvens]
MAESAPGSGLDHPLVEAVRALVARLDAEIVTPDALRRGDVPLEWDGETVAGVRLPVADTPAGDLDSLLASVADELGAPLSELGRAEKQRAVRLLEERGAFAYRKSAEAVAEALGVTRFTVYNYLNRVRG